MKIIVERFNILSQLEHAQPGQTLEPAIFVKRENSQQEGESNFGMIYARPNDKQWLVLNNKLEAGVPPVWSHNKGGAVVRVGLFSYLTADSDPETLVQFAINYGLAALHLAPRDHKIARMMLAVGNVFGRPDRQPGFQCWLGIGFELELE